MNTPAPSIARCVAAALFACTLLVSTAPAEELPAVVSLGDGTYSVTAKAHNVFTRKGKKQMEAAMKAAADYCDQQGKQLKVIDSKTEKPLFPPNFVSATVVFKALDAGDPELLAGASPGPVPSAQTPTDMLYSELTKLDDLRKKGILTDAEFTAEKQKILSRSR